MTGAKAIDAEARKENEQAGQWISMLEMIHQARGIATCVDLSATPFYIDGSGYPVGRPFPWVVSDFGLADAIESGLVKIPQIPVDDNHGQANRPAAYFNLWDWVNDQLPAADKYRPGKSGDPNRLVAHADPAMTTMIGNWQIEFEKWRDAGHQQPPALIIVTNTTEIAKVAFDRITAPDYAFQEFTNESGKPPVSYQYDTTVFKKSDEGKKLTEHEAEIRAVLNSVGQIGQPGEQVRCVVSVSMLTEGWDARNVTHIIGLRPFRSRLLCEQVVGRALRRMSYDVDPVTGRFKPEYAEVYGVPFEVIPVKAGAKGVPPPAPVGTLIRSVPDRRDQYRLSWPIVEGYVTEIRDRVVCNFDNLPTLRVGRLGEPTRINVKPSVGMRVGRPDRDGPGKLTTHNRNPYYDRVRGKPPSTLPPLLSLTSV